MRSREFNPIIPFLSISQCKMTRSRPKRFVVLDSDSDEGMEADALEKKKHHSGPTKEEERDVGAIESNTRRGVTSSVPAQDGLLGPSNEQLASLAVSSKILEKTRNAEGCALEKGREDAESSVYKDQIQLEFIYIKGFKSYKDGTRIGPLSTFTCIVRKGPKVPSDSLISAAKESNEDPSWKVFWKNLTQHSAFVPAADLLLIRLDILPTDLSIILYLCLSNRLEKTAQERV
jgi:hypothetical protein